MILCRDAILPWPCFGHLSLSQESHFVPSHFMSSRSHPPSDGLGAVVAQHSDRPSGDTPGWGAEREQPLARAGLPQPCMVPAFCMVQE